LESFDAAQYTIKDKTVKRALRKNIELLEKHWNDVSQM